MLSTFIWATRQAVERSLVRSGSYRADAAVKQLAGIVAPAVRARALEHLRLPTDTLIRAALRNPTPKSLASAREFLQPRTPSVQASRSELWDAHGKLILTVSNPKPSPGLGVADFPEGKPPSGPEPGEMQAEGNLNFHRVVLEIRDDAAHGSALLGYLARFGQFVFAPRGAIQRLVGDSATIRVGSVATNTWTDFDDIVAPPPQLVGKPENGIYRDSDDRRWIGASVPLEGTPWTAWVGFPRSMIVEPATPFMKQMILLALLFTAGGAGLVVLLGVRLTQPLRALATAVEQMAAGDYSRRVAGHERDEIGRLGSAFNTMTAQIEAASTTLKKSHRQTHFALAAARIGVWETDLSTGALRCSESMNLLHRLPAGRLPETRDEFVNLLHEEDRDTVRSILEGSTTGVDEFDLQYRAYGPGGSLHWMEGKGRLIRDATGHAVSVLGVSIDITDRMRLEGQMRQAQKMEAIGQLAGGIAHDFNNLLTAIIGHGGLMLMDLDDKTQIKSDAEAILRAADTATTMTRQLLAFSRGQLLNPDVIDINKVIVKTEQLLARLIGERITLVTDLASDLYPVKVDEGQLQQVLMNLAVNSRDAMPTGGTLSISSANILLDRLYTTEHSDAAQGWHVMITVTDTGEGMDAPTQARLFEPFFTTKPAGKGTGLGLATVYGIVKQSGGHIYVYSELGHGTTFKIYLPVISDDGAETRKQVSHASLPVTGTEKILVVDDNEAVRVVGQTILERLGYTVVSAETGQEALDILKESDVLPRLLLTDVILPGMTGPELYREVATLYPEMRVIFTSGYSPDAIAPHATLDPGFLFVPKPYNASTLAGKVREALES
jgi:signal transduction histidine kinase/CheY-like chemotaxis protein